MNSRNEEAQNKLQGLPSEKGYKLVEVQSTTLSTQTQN